MHRGSKNNPKTRSFKEPNYESAYDEFYTLPWKQYKAQADAVKAKLLQPRTFTEKLAFLNVLVDKYPTIGISTNTATYIVGFVLSTTKIDITLRNQITTTLSKPALKVQYYRNKAPVITPFEFADGQNAKVYSFFSTELFTKGFALSKKTEEKPLPVLEEKKVAPVEEPIISLSETDAIKSSVRLSSHKVQEIADRKSPELVQETPMALTHLVTDTGLTPLDERKSPLLASPINIPAVDVITGPVVLNTMIDSIPSTHLSSENRTVLQQKAKRKPCSHESSRTKLSKLCKSEDLLTSSDLITEMRESVSSSHETRFQNVFYHSAQRETPQCYSQTVLWTTSQGQTVPIIVKLHHENLFRENRLAVDEKDHVPPPFSWLFTDTLKPELSKRAKKSYGFDQVYSSYTSPAIAALPKYYTFTFFEKDNPDAFAFLFATRDGGASELVNLKKGKALAGQEVYKIAQIYLFGLFPKTKPLLADMSYDPRIEDLNARYPARLESIFLPKQTAYYESLGATLCEGKFHTFYNGSISQNRSERKIAINELHNFPISKVCEHTTKTKGARLKNLFNKYSAEILEEYKSDFETTTLKQLYNKIYARYLTSKNIADKADFMNCLICIDVRHTATAITKGDDVLSKKRLQYLLTQVTWGSFIWQMPPPPELKDLALAKPEIGL